MLLIVISGSTLNRLFVQLAVGLVVLGCSVRAVSARPMHANEGIVAIAADSTVLTYKAFLGTCSTCPIANHRCIPCLAAFDNGALAVVTSKDTITILSSEMNVIEKVQIPFGRPIAMMCEGGGTVLSCLVARSQNSLVEYKKEMNGGGWSQAHTFPTIYAYYRFKARDSKGSSHVPALTKRMIATSKLHADYPHGVSQSLVFASDSVSVWRYVDSKAPFLYHFTRSNCSVADTNVTRMFSNGVATSINPNAPTPVACFFYDEDRRWAAPKRVFFAVSVSEHLQTAYLASVREEGLYLYSVDIKTLQAKCNK